MEPGKGQAEMRRPGAGATAPGALGGPGLVPIDRLGGGETPRAQQLPRPSSRKSPEEPSPEGPEQTLGPASAKPPLQTAGQAALAEHRPPGAWEPAPAALGAVTATAASPTLILSWLREASTHLRLELWC